MTQPGSHSTGVPSSLPGSGNPAGGAAVAAADQQLLSGYVAELLDPFTTRRLAEVGVPGSSQCLVIGAGAGSIAGWLADKLAGEGEVVVTDTDPSQVPAHPGVTALRHNLATDPLRAADFDLIYARSVTVTLPGLRELLGKLVTALVPGGTIVLDELETGYDPQLLDAPDPDAARMFIRYRRAFRSVLQLAGMEPWAHSTHRVMGELGLIDVDTECWARSWRGGQPGCLLLREFVANLSRELAAAGMSRLAQAEFRSLLLDPRLVVRGCLAISTLGRRPDQPERRSSSRWNSQAPAACRPGRPPSG